MSDVAEVLTLEIDETPATQSVARGNAALDGYEKRATAAARGAAQSFEAGGNLMIRTSDRTRNSVERLVSAVEKQAQVYGKTGVERLVAQRDQLIQRLGNEEGAIKRVTAAYDAMIRADAADDVRRLQEETREAKGAMALLGEEVGVRVPRHLRGFIAALPGVGGALNAAFNSIAVIALITVLVEAGAKVVELVKSFKELREEPEKVAAAFLRFGEPLRTQNDELRSTNAHLEETIAKLQGHHENGLKSALFDARVEADKLGESLMKDLDALSQFLEKQGVSTWHQILGAAGTSDIKKIVDQLNRSQNLLLEDFSKRRAETHDPKQVAALQGDFGRRLKNLYEDAQQRLGERQGQPPEISWFRTALGAIGVGAPGIVFQDDATRQKQLAGTSEALRNLMQQAEARIEASGLKTKKDKLEADTEENRARKAFREAIDKIAKETEQVPQLIVGRLVMRSPFEETLSTQSAKQFEGARKLYEQAHTINGIPSSYYYDENGAFRLPAFDQANLNRQIASWYLYPMHFAHSEAGQAAQGEDLVKRELPQYLAQQTEGRQQALNSLEREQKLEEQLTKLRMGPGGERAAIEETYRIRLDYAQRIFDIEKNIIGETLAGYKRVQQEDEARIQRITELEELRRREFDETKRSIDGLLDAAISRSQSLLGALKGMLQAIFLEPVKQGLSATLARALDPALHGKNGQGGIVGAINKLFNRGGGIEDVKLVDGAVPVVIKNFSVSGAASAGQAGSGVLGSILGGAGAGGGEGYWGGGSVPAGSGTVPDVFNLPMSPRPDLALASMGASLGIPMGGAGGGGVMSAAGGSGGVGGILGHLGLGGNAKGAGLLQGLATMAGLGLVTSGMRRGGSAGSLMTVGGGAMMGYGLASMMGMTGYGGAITGAGAGLALAGLQRGGISGLGMSTAGSALVGWQFGGSLGAAIGAAVGFTAGLVRLFVKGASEKVHDKVKALYGVDIQSPGVLKQIVDVCKNGFGGDLDVGIRSPQVRELVRLYAMSTGQKTSLFADVVRSASLTETGGGLYQAPTYVNGTPYTYGSSLPSLAGQSGGILPTASPFQGVPLTVQLSAQQTVDLWRTGTAAAIAGNPRGVADAANQGSQASAARGAGASLLLSPSIIRA